MVYSHLPGLAPDYSSSLIFSLFPAYPLPSPCALDIMNVFQFYEYSIHSRSPLE